MSILGWLTGADDARDAANQGLQQGLGYAEGKYGQGRADLLKYYRKGIDPLRDVYRQANRGAGAYGDALGLGGAEGQQRAYETFMRTPGYMAGLNTGMDAIDRRAASRGMLGSGNTNIDTQRFATDYGSQKFGEYVNQLQPYLGQQMGAAQGIGGMYGNMANQLNANRMGLGGIGYGTHAGIGQNNAGAALAGAPMGLLNLGLNMGGKLLGMLPGGGMGGWNENNKY